MGKKLNFKGLTIEEIAKILEGGISINVHEASDILNAVERNVSLKKKDGFMPNSMWVEAMAQLEGLFEFVEGADGSISSRDIMYVDFNKSQKTSINEMKKKIGQIKKDITKLNKRAEKLQGIEEAVEETKKEVDRLRKRVERKRKSIEGLTDENKIARAEAELKKLEKQLVTAKNKATKVATQSDALKGINSQLEYKNNRLATLQESVKEAKATTVTDALVENERNITALKEDLYEGFTLKRSEYSEGLKKDLAKIDRKIKQAWDCKNEKEVAKLKEQRAKLLEDRADEITIFEDIYRVTKQSSSKSRLNKSIFIRDKIVNTKTGEIVKQGALEKLESKMTMGLSDIFSKNPNKVIPAVEYEAYATLTQSSIVDGYIEIKGNNILVVKDVECAVKTKAVVGRQNKDATDILLERIEDYQDKNVLWDGMSLLDESLFKKDHDMILLRQNFFKSAGFKCNLQDYIKSECKKLGLDYNKDCLIDAYGRKVKISDIKMITTNNSTKFDKFAEEMFGEVEDAKKKMFEHWLTHLEKDWDNLFAIVKYDKSTKFQSGNLVRASYQMFNTLPFGTDKETIEKSMKEILKVTEDYVEELRTNSVAFREYLENVANNEKAKWLIQLMDANADIVNTKQFRDERNAICNSILADARSGHLFVEGNNMTLCSNPVELVKYALGSPDVVVKDGVLDKLASKNSFGKDRDVINIYTTRFKEGEDLVFMRSPHSSASGICVGKNVKNDEIEELFGKKLGENIIIIDSSNHASQSMLNGAD